MAAILTPLHPRIAESRPPSPIPPPPALPSPVLLLQMCHHIQEVKQLHASLIVSGLVRRPSFAGKLVETSVNLSHLPYGFSIFFSIPSPTVFAYNTLIRALTRRNCFYQSLMLYNRLLINYLSPDNYTFAFVLKACSSLKALAEGKQVHCQIIKAFAGKGPDTHVHSSIIHMYMSSGSLDCAERVFSEFFDENTLACNCIITGYMNQGSVEKARREFDRMKTKDIASWSAMISGYVKNRLYEEALGVYEEMVASHVPANESAVVSSLSACANLGALDRGKWIHSCISESGTKISPAIGTALVEMYAKCGSIESAHQLFNKMPDRDVIAWGAMISGFAFHGKAKQCMEVFDEMLASGTRPNPVIFVSVLTACSHGGFVESGCRFFNQMVNDFGIRPSIEHYGCLVDLLSRSGFLSAAKSVIQTMPENPNSVIWGSFLNACRIYKDPKRGSWALRHLEKLEPNSGDRCKLGGLMFASGGEVEEAARVRRLMAEKQLETTNMGQSLIEVDGVMHEFTAGDATHKRRIEIYDTVLGLTI